MNNDRIYYSHDAEIHSMHARNLLTLVFLMFGLGIGAILALLFAPSSGKSTRHDLVKSVGEGLRTGRDAVEPIVKRVEKEFGDLQKNVEEHLTSS
jgi:gas vesicle protein